MKKIGIIFILIFLNLSPIFAKKPKVYLCTRIVTSQNDILSNQFEDENVKFTFDAQKKYLLFDVFNKTDQRMIIEWENVRIDNSAVAFGTDRRIKMDEMKAEEVVFPQTSTIHHELIPKNIIQESYIDEWFNTNYVSFSGEQFFKIIVPVRFKDNVIDYTFEIGVSCLIDGERTRISLPTEEQISKISVGMTHKEVSAIIGNPFRVWYNNKTLTAIYINDLQIEYSTEGMSAYKLAFVTAVTKSKGGGMFLQQALDDKQKVLSINTSRIHEVESKYILP